MRYLSLFSGIGGFELGIEQAYELSRVGTESEDSANSTSEPPQHRERPLCIGYSELDKYAIQIYEKHFNHKNYGDITRIKAEELPDFDLLVGGFPCQAFSIAGKRGGFDDTRGTLFFEIARILSAKRPRLFLLENVKGLLSHDEGRTFRTIISTLDELGYDLQWQVLNSKNHGVPQNRERVFIIGHLRGTRRPEVFPFGEEYPANNGEVVGTLMARDYKGVGNQEMALVCQYDAGQAYRVYKKNGISPTVSTPSGGNHLPKIEDGMKIRRLTPTECESLQGFPDGWTEGVSDTQRYKTLGNAVTVNVIRDIMSKLLSDKTP